MMAVAMTSCDDFLNDNRYPGSIQTVGDDFWNYTVNVQNQINYFYEDFLGYGNGTGYGNFYFKWTTDDQCGRTAFAQWLYQNTSPSMSDWNSPYTEIRRANLVIEGVTNGTLTGAEAANFIATARLYRARQYFTLVKKFGDVPLVEKALDPTDEAALFGPRTNRNDVMDYVLADLNFAIENITAQNGKTVFSKDLANAMKAEICLYEASYARYYQKNEARAQKFYNEVVSAGTAIASKYPIGSDFTSLYKSFNGAGGGYNGLSTNSEVIFMKPYAQSVLMHSTMDYSCASDGIAGITRDAFDSFLLLNGTVATEDKGVYTEDGLSIQNLLDVRDQRLAMTTYPAVMFHGMEYYGPNTAAMYSETGYGVSKYDNWTIPASEATSANTSYTCAPLFWGARLYLAILEAKAELGNITDSDLNTYMAPLWKRAGFTVTPTVGLLSSINDPNNNMGVSSLIWEIRRCRRCELMMDDDIRYWDLVRWNKLELLDTNKNPKIAQGANISMVPENKLDAARVKGDYLDCTYGQTRVYNTKYNLFPIPTNQITLNPALTQNPGW